MKVKLGELKKVTRKAILAYGYTAKEAEVIEDVLLYAQLRGNNQGIVKLIGKGIPKNLKAKPAGIEKQTKLSAVINGRNNHAMLVMKMGVDLAVKKAKKSGFGMVGLNHTNTSSGAIGYYAREIAKNGLMGWVFAGSPETVATHGSYEPIFGTNPLAVGIPTKKEPLVLDMATAAMAYYGLIEAQTAGRKIPEGIAYDSEGNLTTDPAKAMDGALRTFDKGYKGAGLAMMVQILTGPLVGASFTGIGDTATNWGHLIMVIDPKMLGGRRVLEAGVSQMIEKVKGVKKLPEVREILVPSERGDRKTKEAEDKGEVEIEENLYKELVKVASGKGIDA